MSVEPKMNFVSPLPSAINGDTRFMSGAGVLRLR